MLMVASSQFLELVHATDHKQSRTNSSSKSSQWWLRRLAVAWNLAAMGLCGVLAVLNYKLRDYAHVELHGLWILIAFPCSYLVNNLLKVGSRGSSRCTSQALNAA